MRAWFKYSKGYVNINNTNIFLTRSGNRQETVSPEEKNKWVRKRNEWRYTRVGIFLIVVFLLFYRGCVPVIC